MRRTLTLLIVLYALVAIALVLTSTVGAVVPVVTQTSEDMRPMKEPIKRPCDLPVFGPPREEMGKIAFGDPTGETLIVPDFSDRWRQYWRQIVRDLQIAIMAPNLR